MKSQGVKLALITALVSGVSIFVNRFAVKAVGDPLVLTTVKSLGVGVIMLAILSRKTVRGEIAWKSLSRADWAKLVVIGIVGGSVPFYLFFKGLALASSAKAALLHKSLMVWIALLAVPLLKEKVSVKQAGALALILASNFVIGGLGEWSWGRGETMILAATVLWAVENVIAKVVLKKVPVDIVVGARMIFGSILLLLATLITGKLSLIFKLSGVSWMLIILTMGLLTLYVVSWYKALQKAPAILVATVLSLGSVITNVLSSIFITHKLPIGIVYQSILLVAGAWFFYIETLKDLSISLTRRTKFCSARTHLSKSDRVSAH